VARITDHNFFFFLQPSFLFFSTTI